MSDWPEVRQAGDRGLLVDLGQNAPVHALAMAARAHWRDELEDVVPGHTTLLLTWRPGKPIDAERLTAEIRGLQFDPDSYQPPRLLTIPVRYDGPDLDEVAATIGVSTQALIEIHAAPEYRAAFTGFSPGFTYLLGGDPRLDLPRRSDPRVHVDAGSVAIAAGYTAVYPTAGPGGWHLIGHTDVTLFDPEREPPTLIEPWAIVRFEAVS